MYFDVDATNLGAHQGIEGNRYDRIIFNFPHTAVQGADIVSSNQVFVLLCVAMVVKMRLDGDSDQSYDVPKQLLRGFFESACQFLSWPDGEIHVALRTNPFYASWKISQQIPHNMKLERCDFN